MSRPTKDIMILSEKGIITEEALLAYARNELAAGDKQELEKLLQDDPFAREALEGLQTTKDNKAVADRILNVNKKVRERTGIKEKKTFEIHWTNYAWAAVVLGLLIGIGFVLVNYMGKKKEQPIAVQTPKAEEKPAIIVAPPIAKADSIQSNKNDTAAVLVQPLALTVAPPKAATADTKGVSGPTGKTGTTAAPVSSFANAGQAVAGTGMATAMNYTQSKPVNTLEKTAATTNGNGAASQKQGAVTAVPSADKTPVNVDDAMKSFNSGDYKTAGEGFDNILKKDPDNLDALYFGAISDYIDNKTSKSETQFDKVLKKNGKYTDGAKWYKANILLKKGDLERSKNILQELSNTNNPYKERAIKKMAEMGF